MIISHKFRYLFVELPRTGSTAITQELCEHYDGARILFKHATYGQFLRTANDEEKRYFVFSGIRNPLDSVVSFYFKCKNDHRQQFSQKKAHSRMLGYFVQRRFRFIQGADVDFATFFMRFYKVPYNNWSSLSHSQFDYVIRFENLQYDFAQVLKLVGIEQKRPLPSANKTGGKVRDFWSYYTPETIARAKWVFGPFMERWGYEFPPEWGDASVSWSSQMVFRFLNIFRDFYWRNLRLRVSGF